jgi:hypothetical protein
MTFEDFYRAYPRKVAKLDAEKAWKQMLSRGYDAAEIVRGAELFAKQCRSEAKEQQFIPYPASWLRAGRWLDADIQETIVPKPSETLFRKVETLDELKHAIAARHGGQIPANLALDLKRAKTLEDVDPFLRNTMVPKAPLMRVVK